MEVAIVKESKNNESRVALVPEDITSIVNAGFTVYVEKNAGEGIGIPDSLYEDYGAKIVDKKRAWESNVIIKYKGLTAPEYEYVHAGQKIFAIFHAEGDKNAVTQLCEANVDVYSYEYFKTQQGYYPLAFAGSEITGKMAVIYASYLLQKSNGGSGVLLANVVGVKQPHVVVIGYGNAGGAAVRTALALGARVTVFGTSKEKLRKFQATLNEPIDCYILEPGILAKAVKDADAVIGAILISTYDTEPILTDEMVRSMKKGAIIIDITCGYGDGYMPTFNRHSNFKKPSYTRYGVLHCKIDIMPSNFPKTASYAFSKQLSQYMVEILEMIYFQKDIQKYDWGKIISGGELVNDIVAGNLILSEIY